VQAWPPSFLLSSSGMHAQLNAVEAQLLGAQSLLRSMAAQIAAAQEAHAAVAQSAGLPRLLTPAPSVPSHLLSHQVQPHALFAPTVQSGDGVTQHMPHGPGGARHGSQDGAAHWASADTTTLQRLQGPAHSAAAAQPVQQSEHSSSMQMSAQAFSTTCSTNSPLSSTLQDADSEQQMLQSWDGSTPEHSSEHGSTAHHSIGSRLTLEDLALAMGADLDHSCSNTSRRTSTHAADGNLERSSTEHVRHFDGAGERTAEPPYSLPEDAGSSGNRDMSDIQVTLQQAQQRQEQHAHGSADLDQDPVGGAAEAVPAQSSAILTAEQRSQQVIATWRERSRPPLDDGMPPMSAPFYDFLLRSTRLLLPAHLRTPPRPGPPAQGLDGAHAGDADGAVGQAQAWPAGRWAPRAMLAVPSMRKRAIASIDELCGGRTFHGYLVGAPAEVLAAVPKAVGDALLQEGELLDAVRALPGVDPEASVVHCVLDALQGRATCCRMAAVWFPALAGACDDGVLDCEGKAGVAGSVQL
jgi:hypothetical protein